MRFLLALSILIASCSRETSSEIWSRTFCLDLDFIDEISSEKVSSEHRKSLSKQLSCTRFGELIRGTILLPHEIYHRYGFFLTAYERDQFVLKVEKTVGARTPHQVFSEFESEFDFKIKKSFDFLNSYLEIPDTQRVWERLKTDHGFAKVLNLVDSRAKWNIVEKMWIATLDFRPFAGDLVHFINLSHSQGFFSTRRLIIEDWGKDALMRSYIHSFDFDHVSARERKSEIEEFIERGLKFLLEEHGYVQTFRMMFLEDIIKKRPFDKMKAGSRLAEKMRIYTDLHQDTVLTHPQTEELLRWNVPLVDYYDSFSATYDLNSPQHRERILSNTVKHLLRRNFLSPNERKHYLKRTLNRSPFDLEYDILRDRPQFASVDWDRVPLWEDLKKSTSSVESIQTITIPGVENAYNPSLIKHPYRDTWILIARYDTSFERKNQKSYFAYVELDLNEKPIKVLKHTAISALSYQSSPTETGEDPRLCECDGDIYFTFNDHDKDKQRKIFFSKLQLKPGKAPVLEAPKEIRVPTGFPNQIEKNWTPLCLNSEFHYVYAIDFDAQKNGKNFLVIKPDYRTGKTQVVAQNKVDFKNYSGTFGKMKGGTPFISTPNGLLTFPHSTSIFRLDPDKNAALFYTFAPVLIQEDASFEVKAFTEYPMDFPGFYELKPDTKALLFPSGVVMHKDKLFIAAGRNDNSILMIVVDYNHLMKEMGQ